MGYEVDFLCVGDGSGDAICIRHQTPDGGHCVSVVDGGHGSTSEKIIKHIEAYYHGRGTIIGHVVLSHADDDHARGLIEVLKHFDVRHLWMNRPWLYAAQTLANFHGNFTLQGLIDDMKEKHPYLVEMEKIATEKGIPIHEVFQGERIDKFIVLAPSRERYISLIPDLPKTPQSYAQKKSGVLGALFGSVTEAIGRKAEEWGFETLSDDPPATSASNETSVVQLGVFDLGTVLLTADVGPAGLAEAADFAESIGRLAPPTLVQVPHHGSRRNVTPKVLDRWLGLRVNSSSEIRGSAFCSVGSNAVGYPRKVVSNAFLRRGYPVISTQNYTCIHHFRGNMDNRGWGPAAIVPFASEVEDYS